KRRRVRCNIKILQCNISAHSCVRGTTLRAALRDRFRSATLSARPKRSRTSAAQEPQNEVVMAVVVKALLFDVFGTLVDWRTSIARESEAILKPLGISVDWFAFA